MLFGADGKPLNQSLSRFTDPAMQPLAPIGGKPVTLEPGRAAPSKPEDSLSVHTDSRAPSFASLLQAGEAYRPTVMESARMSPEVCCPKCNQICTGFKHSVPEFKIPDLPEELVRHLFVSETCGCSVTQEWAGAINAELQHRQSGGTPRQVVEMTDGQRKTLYARLEKRLHALMSEHEAFTAKDSPAALRVATLISTMLTVMQYVAEPLRDLNVYQESKEFVKHQYDAPVKLEPKDFDYNPNAKLPDLQKAATKAALNAQKVDKVFNKFQTQKATQPQSQSAEPSPQLLGEAVTILGGLDWVGTIAGAFPNVTTQEARCAVRLGIVDSIFGYNRNQTPLSQDVHKFLYFVRYGCAVPSALAKGGVEGDSINASKAVPSTPVIRAVPGHAYGNPTPIPAPPPVNPEDFHRQFERKKRRVRKVDRPPET